MTERINMQTSFEVLQNKFVGTGHSDMTKWEWGNNIQRDSLASHIGHKSRLVYMSTALNESTFRTKHNFLTVSILFNRLENDTTSRSITEERRKISLNNNNKLLQNFNINNKSYSSL